ncbi:MAG: ribose 5-phosphate isomerase B [Acidimicrobiales bacterium]
MAVGADHAGRRLKDVLAARLRDRGVEVVDLGTFSDEAVDYPEFGVAVGEAVAAGRVDLGLCVCGSGIGIAIAANKVHGVRAATVHDVSSARLAREHNDANVVCIGARLTGDEVALDALDAFLAARFAGGRHAARVAKLDALGTVNASSPQGS